MDIHETVDAKKERIGPDEALKLVHSASTVIVAKGKKVVQVDMKTNPPSDDVLLQLVMGPTGNMRAPTMRKGTTLLVGFDAEAYHEALGEQKAAR